MQLLPSLLEHSELQAAMWEVWLLAAMVWGSPIHTKRLHVGGPINSFSWAQLLSHFSPSARHVSEGAFRRFQPAVVESSLSHSSFPSWGPQTSQSRVKPPQWCSVWISGPLNQEHTKMVIVYTTKVGWFIKQQEITETARQPRVLPDIQPNAWRHGHLFSIKEGGSFLEGWEWHWAKDLLCGCTLSPPGLWAGLWSLPQG